MERWQSRLNANPTDWLLEDTNPSVRYLTLTQLMDAPETDAAVKAARRAVMETGYVPALLQKLFEPDSVAAWPRFYTNKYQGLVWSLIVLAEHRAARTPQVETLCEYLLTHAQEITQGGFSQHEAVKAGGGRLSEVIPCLTGNMVWALTVLGYGQDGRVQRGLMWLVRYLRLNDGVMTEPQDAPYDRLEACWGAHTCHMGVVKALKAYGAVPEDSRDPALQAAVGRAAEFMLIHNVDRRSHNLSRIAKPGWRKPGFPLMYQTDTLETLDVLAALGYRDPRMGEAVEAMLMKQDERGRWHNENPYASERLLIPMEVGGEPSKWLTLRALRVMKRYFG